MDKTQYFVYEEYEINYLKTKDPVLGAAMNLIGEIKRPIIPDLFMALLNSIVGQQISTKALATIWERMQINFAPLTPEHLVTIPTETLQTCGISFRKATYIKEIAEEVQEKRLDLTSLCTMSDHEICKRLCQVNGIGVWTAEMLMTFSMQRKNVMSWGDLAIHRGLRMLYHHRKITPALFAKYKRRYAPFATIACLYLWAIASGKYEEFVDYAPMPKTKKANGNRTESKITNKGSIHTRK